MLAEISPEQMDRWQAWWILDGNILERIERMLAMIGATLNNRMSKAFGGPLLDMEHFLLRPKFGDSPAAPESRPPMSPQVAAAAFLMHYGDPPGQKTRR